MKKLILIVITLFPIFTYAEYNGVHVQFKIEFKNGNQIIGYKYVAHGLNTLEYKKQLEIEPKAFLLNEFTYEPGEYGYYTERLAYSYNELKLYKLIHPVEVKIDEINKVEIIDLITASYAIQIIGDYSADDQHWMNSKPIAKYSDFEEMCAFDIFIHTTNDISVEIQDTIKNIINDAASKVKAEEAKLNDSEVKYKFYQEKVQAIYKERNSKILNLFKEHKQLKSITISMCTC